MAFSCLVMKPIPIVILLMVSSIFRTNNGQISTPCTSSMISTFTPCLNYVTRSTGTGSSPTQDCCNSFKSLMEDSMDCTCLIVTGNVPLSIPFINRNLAISLPRICATSVPIQCKASGVPLPPPGPVAFQPSPAPGASAPHAHNPKDSEGAGVFVPVPVPAPAESQDIEPASPPNLSLGPTANPGIRPVLNPKSATNRFMISLPFTILISLGIIVAFNFLG